MTDQQLELDLRAWFRAYTPASERAPASLRDVVMDIPRHVVAPGLVVSQRRIALIAAAAALVIAMLTLLLAGPGARPNPSMTPEPSPSPSARAVGPLWREVGSLAEGRARNDWSTASFAVLLQDGRVLAAGGLGNSGALVTAEIYDPSSETWAPTAPMADARAGHTVTTLADGRVLVVGGNDGKTLNAGPLASAEIYDPVLETWRPTGTMHHARVNHVATLLPDGRVLVAGGNGPCQGDPCGGETDTASAELYDPATGQWTETDSMTQARYNHSAALLADGTVLVEGSGHLAGWSSAEIYDPGLGTWRATGAMFERRAGMVSTLLPDGRILVVGGQVKDHLTDPIHPAEIYDPANGSWTLTSGSSTQASGLLSAFRPAVALLSDGRVLVVSGQGSRIFDATQDSWAAINGPALVQSTAVRLADGRVLLIGGQDDNDSRLSLTDIFDPLALR